MTNGSREDQLVDTFASLADTLVDNYDIVDLLQNLVDSCASVFDIAAAGILLVDDRNHLEVVASTSEGSRLVEVMQLAAQSGPCVECFETGQIVSVPDIEKSPERWSKFKQSASEQGFLSVYAIPLRLRTNVIGALNLLRTERGELNPIDVRAATAFANVATIGVLNERTLRESNLVRDQLQYALNARVVIEQAKGVLAYTHKVTTEAAFELLRSYARSHGMKLGVVAEKVVSHELSF